MRFLLLLLLVSCAPEPQPPPPEETPKNILHLAIQTDPYSLDPRVGGDRRAQVVTKMLFDGLTRIGPDGNPMPSVAEAIAISEDGKTYTFLLRESNWSTGDKLTAYDFAYGWKRALKPEFSTNYAHVYGLILNAKKARAGEVSLDEVGIKAVDDRTLVVELEHPAPYFLDLISNGTFFPVSGYLEKLDPNWSSKAAAFVSNGPFRLVSWDKGKELRLEKNPEYWDAENVELDGITLHIISDPVESVARFDQGELQWVGEPLTELPSDPRQQSTPIAGIYRYHFNVNEPPFDSPKVRRAFAYAIDRPALCRDHCDGATVATSVLPPGLSFEGDPLLERASRADAQILFEEFLAEQGITRKEFPPVVLSYNNVPGERAIAESVQKQWQEVFDIPVSLEGYEWNIYRTKLTNNGFQVAGATWFSWINDPIYNLDGLKSLWNNPEYNALIESSNWESDPKIRNAQLKEAEKLAMQEMPIAPVYVTSYKYLSHPHIIKFLITPSGQVDFKWASMGKSAMISPYEDTHP